MTSIRIVAAMVLSIAWGGSHSAAAQQSAAANRPAIEGSWERFGFIFGPRTEAQKADPRIPPPSPPPPLKAPYLKEWQERVAAAREADAKGQPLASGYTTCLPDGMPSMMAAMFPIEILVSAGRVTIIEEAFNQVRRILLDQPQKALEDIEPGFYGRSVGRFDGDSLIVDTLGIKETVRYQNVAHSKDLRIRERLHLAAPDILWDEVTMEDAATLEKPWTVIYAYKRMPNYTLLEYICEDNREYADDQGRQKIRLDPAAR